VIGRHGQSDTEVGFQYNGLAFDESMVHVFAGLCAVDSRESVRAMMAELQKFGIQTTRMGAYKPRTSPYDFQGLGAECLPWVFEEAGKHDIKVVAMEVCDGRQIEEIQAALETAGNPTGVMLQIGTRNTQNFELLKLVGQQGEMPVLFKRGMGITLEESLNACEYVASEGQPNIVFCLRGVKSHLGEPHRNLVDFAHVPVVRSQTRLPVVIDPSHSVGRFHTSPDGLPEVFHATGQGVIAGASLVLVDFHPDPRHALCDGPQALTLDYLPRFLDYVKTVRAAYEAVL
jgi:3-deoxy-7-phosphoheptulonate synthase